MHPTGQPGRGRARGSPKILSLRDGAGAAKKCGNRGGGEERCAGLLIVGASR